jgi:outer membrane translocation and assembly module TamA
MKVNIELHQLCLMATQCLTEDNALQTIQTEYRHILTEKVGINLFLSEGAVGESLQEVSKKASHVTGGIGFRYIIVKESNLGLRLDIARTSEETSIYFGAGEAF